MESSHALSTSTGWSTMWLIRASQPLQLLNPPDWAPWDRNWEKRLIRCSRSASCSRDKKLRSVLKRPGSGGSTPVKRLWWDACSQRPSLMRSRSQERMLRPLVTTTWVSLLASARSTKRASSMSARLTLDASVREKALWSLPSLRSTKGQSVQSQTALARASRCSHKWTVTLRRLSERFTRLSNRSRLKNK